MDWRTHAALFDDEGFFAAWLDGDAERAQGAAGGVVRCHDPQAGPIAPTHMKALARAAQRRFAPLGVSYRRVGRIDLPHRSVAEGLFSGIDQGRAFSIPVCAVMDNDPRDLRLYYTLWPLTGAHRLRPPLLDACDEPRLSDVIAEYQQALAGGDVQRLLACFEPAACAREPSGLPWIHCGPAGLRAFYGAILAQGGIPLRHCTATDDGVACAIEYIAVRWGKATLPPQAGVAIYERGPSGRLRAARIYDDVTPPFE